MKARGFFYALYYLVWRQFLTVWRNYTYSLLRLCMCFGSAFFFGVVFFQVGTGLGGAINSIASIFFLAFILSTPMTSAAVPMVADRAVLHRETHAGAYTHTAYGVGQLIADFPFHILNTFGMFIAFYFLVGFELNGGTVGYFLLMLFLANWVLLSLGQLFAFISPNEEAATGIAGLTVILSVCLMGFLITVDGMPDGWKWANQSNLYRFILQGLCTNQLSQNSYHLDLGVNYNDTLELPFTPEHGLIFEPNVNPLEETLADRAVQVAGILAAGLPGINNNTIFADDPFAGLITVAALGVCLDQCMVQDGKNFITCCIVAPNPRNSPPCKDQYNAFRENNDVTAIAACFLNEPNKTSTDENRARGTPDSFEYNSTTPNEEVELAICLTQAIIPPEGINIIEAAIKDIYDLALFIIDVLDNGLSIPGNLILLYFGWSSLDGFGNALETYKWYYCMFAVGMFIVGLEICKIITLRFVVWTKR
jgi:ABC-type multidrug transport system permease subunit